MGCAAGPMFGEPVAEQRRHLARQAQRDRRGRHGAGIARRFEDRLQLVIGERRDHRRGHYPDRDAGPGQPGDAGKPPGRGRHPGLERAGQAGIERRHRDTDGGEAVGGQARDQVDVALDQRALGGDQHRVAEVAEHFEQTPHQRIALLDRLVGIGIGAEGERRRPVAGGGKLACERLGGAGAGDEAGFEIQPRRQAEKGVAWPGEAVDAAVLAAAIGVDRAVETQIGRGVAGDHPARPLLGDLGAERRQFLGDVPAVMDRLARIGLEPAAGIRGGGAAAPAGGIEAGRFGLHRPNSRT